MPRVNIYIRKEDEAKWQAIENKPEWLHEHLNHAEFDRLVTLVDNTKENILSAAQKRLDNKLSVLVDEGLEQLENIKLCQHYQPKGEQAIGLVAIYLSWDES